MDTGVLRVKHCCQARRLTNTAKVPQRALNLGPPFGSSEEGQVLGVQPMNPIGRRPPRLPPRPRGKRRWSRTTQPGSPSSRCRPSEGPRGSGASGRGSREGARWP
eukprot:12014576-Alexandrium_andersonii.AAC.1